MKKRRFTPPRRWSLAQCLDHYIDKRGRKECWPWQGYADPAGYGRMGWKRKMRRASHLVWEVAHGRPLADGMMALHTCDSPPCCNPAHLYEGDIQDNHDDMDRRGRRRVGARHPSAKLTEEDVHAIRVDGRTLVVIAEQYGVSWPLISAIKRRRIWKHLKERRR